ncbi:helix-turn-helix domain-containing protein [Macrococcoides bohemicum]|uniref:helix-turn-helix domain-containing protein n=1 Tax=Macrococcoides bohemicum TaxID=1903056 RepID=UPI00165D90D5|nr:helix-turn-helix domain-containing protein [Macrococcus bohemicus]MBC9875540.1 helix-turn-helix domain-containing protein [Macrococcus bohemicus]
MIRIKLKEVLSERDMTLNDLSDITGISPKTLSLFQNQKTESVHYKTIDKICTKLNINVQDIIEVVIQEEKVEVDALEVFMSESNNVDPHDILKVLFKQIISVRMFNNKYEYCIELKNGNIITKSYNNQLSSLKQNIFYDYRKNVEDYYA